ncbi:MAG: hypothetical protein Q8Q89_03150 [bacterium]|nr:hypothetical protein [bacterium]
MIKKYLLIIFGPIILAILNGYISSYYFLSWGYDNRNSLSIILFAVSFFSCLYVLFLNSKTKKNKVWFIVPSIIAVLNILIIYAIYSLSSFGF